MHGTLGDLWMFNTKTGTWVTPMAEGQAPCQREMHSGTMLTDSRFLICGGRSAAGQVCSSSCHMPAIYADTQPCMGCAEQTFEDHCIYTCHGFENAFKDHCIYRCQGLQQLASKWLLGSVKLSLPELTSLGSGVVQIVYFVHFDLCASLQVLCDVSIFDGNEMKWTSSIATQYFFCAHSAVIMPISMPSMPHLGASSMLCSLVILVTSWDNSAPPHATPERRQPKVVCCFLCAWYILG